MREGGTQRPMFSFPLHPEGLGLDTEKYRKRAFADQTDQKEMGEQFEIFLSRMVFGR